MKNYVRLSSVCAVIVALGLAAATPAVADGGDYGDGKLSCNVGEICLAQDNDGVFAYQKHFFWDAKYDGYYFVNVFTGATGGPVRDQVSAVKNRDTSCPVTLYNDRWPLPSQSVTFAAGSTSWVFVGSVMNDQADRHVRCAK